MKQRSFSFLHQQNQKEISWWLISSSPNPSNLTMTFQARSSKYGIGFLSLADWSIFRHRHSDFEDTGRSSKQETSFEEADSTKRITLGTSILILYGNIWERRSILSRKASFNDIGSVNRKHNIPTWKNGFTARLTKQLWILCLTGFFIRKSCFACASKILKHLLRHYSHFPWEICPPN